VRVLAVLATFLLLVAHAVGSDAASATVCFLIGEPEYGTATSLPAFASAELVPRGLTCTYATEDRQDAMDFVGMDAVAQADLLIISVRRHAPRAGHLALVRAHLAAGKPVIGIRTASHAFAATPADADHAAWPGFDQEILGGSYGGHDDDVPVLLSLAPGAREHPILQGVDLALLATRKLYRNPTLVPSATSLVLGTSQGSTAIQQVAWTNQVGGSRIFYTSMGLLSDVANPAFRRLLTNAVFWALRRVPPP
jgi:type 1 glutamine amidotransferase